MTISDHSLCIIIPVFNHSYKIRAVLDRINTFHLPIYLVDDGSNEECAAVLSQLALIYKCVRLYRFEENQGKGAAVCFALKQAENAGYTHALQVDADGQHDLADLPLFLEKSRTYPDAVISAERAYAEMPEGRRKGRKVTDVWVTINTLSFAIKDSMCGFRLYPLVTTCSVLGKYNIGRRMDFDTDILVRLYWEGLEVVHVPSRVIYQDDIVSHFDLFMDNVRISLMHAKLFFGMIVRIPKLLSRHG